MSETSGVSCPPGKFCPGGEKLPEACTAQPGFFCPKGSETGNGVPAQPGYFAAGGEALEEPCVASPGRYCKGGGVSTEAEGETECPVGAYCIGFHFVAQPCAAEPGFYCPAGSDSAAGIECEAGFACPGAEEDRVLCQALPGRFCPQQGSDPKGVSCPAGHFCEGGQAVPSPCVAAPGFFCPGTRAMCLLSCVWVSSVRLLLCFCVRLCDCAIRFANTDCLLSCLCPPPLYPEGQSPSGETETQLSSCLPCFPLWVFFFSTASDWRILLGSERAAVPEVCSRLNVSFCVKSHERPKK